MWRLLIRSPIVVGAVRGLATAAIAGIGWKLGADAYDAAKERIQKRQRHADREIETDAG